MLIRRLLPVLFVTLLVGTQVGCDDKSKKSKSEEDDDDKGSKKKKKKKGDDDGDDDDKSEKSEKKSKKPVEVPGCKGFVVPAGGVYEHKTLKLGDKTMEMETYRYMVKDFPRPALRKSLDDVVTKAGWSWEGDPLKETSVKAKKDGVIVPMLIGEANEEATQFNIFAPK